MSLIFKTNDGREKEAMFLHPPSKGVLVDTIEIPMVEFCQVATHFLSGGIYGWEGHGHVPPAVSRALTCLFERYEQVNGKWKLREVHNKQ